MLVKVEANIYGARKKLKKEDLVLADGSKLPPEDLASLGSKRLLDPDELTVFNRLKKEAERICLRIGTRFLGGYAIPKESAPGIIAELERIALDFAAAKTDFLAGYDAAVKDWVVRHPEFAGIIEKAVDTVEFVSTRLSFDFLLVSVGLPEVLPAEDVAKLESKICSLSEQMFYEIAVDANQFIEQSLLGKDQVTRNAVRPIRRMRDKLDGLGFLDYRVAPVVNTIDDLLVRIPEKGALEGGILQEILATAMLLADPDKTRRHGEGLLAAQSVLMDSSVDSDLLDMTVLENKVTQVEQVSQLDHMPISRQEMLPLVDDSQFSDLFAGIFDDDFDLEDDSLHLEDAVLIKQSNESSSVTQCNGVIQAKPDNEAELELVTTENDTEEMTHQDYWF